jgi:small redox-active disulfide protein 2
MLSIKVLGPGCANCRKLEQVAREAADSLGIAVEITKIADMNAIIAYGVLKTPGLVINERLVSSGRIPGTATVAEWLRAAQSSPA